MSGLAAQRAQISQRFAERVTANGQLFLVVGDAGPALIASQIRPDSQLALLWSDAHEAARWADVLAANPRIEAITLTELQTMLLPEYAAAGVLIGPDWSADPVEPELEVAAVQARLAECQFDRFAASVVGQDHLFLLRGPDGLAGLAADDPAVAGVLPVWAGRDGVQAFAEGPFAGFAPQRVSLADFTQRTLLWCIEAGWRIAPQSSHGVAVAALRPAELKARFRTTMERRTARPLQGAAA